MELKTVNLFLLIALSICFVQNAIAMPRDSAAIHDESVVPISSEALAAKEDTTKLEKSTTELTIPGRISCKYEEPTDDTICQEHCLPKGYNYGICVSYTCSCI
uniref:Defensin n=1 Tax=Trichoplusia ni TaxID=7111 RepID=A9XXA6_TRINI|nr:defensin [Trichoplusia ni]